MFNSLNSYPSKNIYVIASGFIGNLLEAFDVMLCAFLSKIIADAFFPRMLESNKLFYVFNIFLVGYLSRPLGALLISLYADQIGRKKMLIFSILAVGIGTTAIGCLPSYEAIGASSCILFLLFRMIQNISIGGEYITSIAYLIEHGEEKKRGFYGCWVAMGFNSGTLFASLFAFTITYLINIGAAPAWSWRIMFISSLLGMILGVWMRLSIPESIGFILENSSTALTQKTNILRQSLQFIKQYKAQCMAIFLIAWFGVCTTFSIFIYSPIHMNMINTITQHESLGINTVSLALLIVLVPFFGIISDYINRIAILITSSILILLFSYPYFWYLSYGSYYEILSIKLIFSVFCASYFSIAPVLITEVFPLKIRCTSIALIYQTASSLAAGLTPVIMLYLANKTSQPYSPCYVLIGSALFGIFALLFLKQRPIATNDALKLDNTLALHNRA